MADPAFPDHLLASPDHALVLPDHLLGVHRHEPVFPDRVLDFPDDDLAVEIKEDYGIDIDEEDPEEDLDINVEDDDEDEGWNPTTLNFHLGYPRPYTNSSIVPMRLEVHPTEDEEYPDYVQEVERAMVRDIGWLGERDEIIQARTLSLVRRVDSLSDDQVADSTAISELQPRMTVVVDRVQTLVEQGEHIANILDVAEMEVLELRDIMDNYPHGKLCIRWRYGLQGVQRTTRSGGQTSHETALT
ncbi:hypothetical protein Tco_1255020 [Tanacetum coccineum]